MSGEETGSGSHFLWRPGDFLSSEPHRKPVFLVDSIIELCINVQEMCAQGCGSINLSLPVSFSEIESYDSQMLNKIILSCHFDV